MTDINETERKKSNEQLNKEFEEYIEKTKIENKKLDEEKLKNLSKEQKFHDLTFADIFIGIKDTCFGIYDDILNRNFSIDMFKKNNRLFFLGIIIVVITVILFICTELSSSL